MFRSQGLSELRHQTPRRICIIKPSALGDVVQALPLLPVLKARFPGASISWVINRELRDLVDGHPQVDEVIAFERRGRWKEWLRLLAHLRSRQFDLVIDFQGLARSALMTVATGARWRVGLQTAREGASLVTNYVVPDSGWNVPAHARLWRLAESLDLGDFPRRAQVPATELDRAWADEILQRLPRPVIAVHAGAGWITKRWPLEKFAELLNRCSQNWNSSVILLGGPGERGDVDQLRSMVGQSSATVNLAGKTTIRQLAHLLTQVDLTISNDSGPMHLSAELGTPTLGIFTCTSPTRSGPPGSQHEMVSTTVPCAASYCKRCPHQGDKQMACLRELDVERAWQALQRMVTRNNISLPSKRVA